MRNSMFYRPLTIMLGILNRILNKATTRKPFASTTCVGLSIRNMPGYFYYKPLALALAFLLLAPPISWVSGVGHTSRAEAQIVISGCAGSPDRIIQNLGILCDPNFPAQFADVQQFESDTVRGYLAAHSLPQTDSSLIYQVGRSDLRSELRGYMLARLLAITQTPQLQRTAHEQALFLAFQKKVQQYEIELYSSALAEYNRWQSDPCRWRPDTDIAAKYNLSYDHIPFCFPNPLASLFSAPNFPSYDYFIGFGLLKNSYGKAVSGQVDGPYIQALAGQALGLAMATIALPAALGAAVTVGTLVAIFASSIVPFAFYAGTAAGAISAVAAGTVSVAALAAGPAAIILIAVLIGVAAGFQAFSAQQNTNNLNNLVNQLSNARANPPDIASFAKDPSAGMYKLNATFTALTLPEFSSTQTLPTHRNTDPVFVIANSGQSNPQASSQLGYTSWNGTKWTASTYGGWLVQQGTPQNGTPIDSITPTIFYLDWNGNQYSASRVGMNFLIAKGRPAATDTACAVNTPVGLTIVPDYTVCSSYVQSVVQLKDSLGNNVSVSLGVPPSFTSGSSANFAPGIAKTFMIAATGVPAPAITQTGVLPTGISFTAGPPATLSGTAAAGTEGTYPITLKAQSAAGSVTQNFTLNIGTKVVFTSPGSATFTAGQFGSFSIITTGKPTPSLALNTSIPGGLNFKDNGDGTATISGTPNPPPPFGQIILCNFDGTGVCGVIATNALGVVGQTFSITVNPAPLTIASFPSGLAFSISAAGGLPCNSAGNYFTPKTFILGPEESCAAAFATPQSAGVGVQNIFTGYGLIAANPRTIVMPAAPSTYTAQFRTQYFTTTTVTSGSGTYSDPVTLSAVVNAVNPVALSVSGQPLIGSLQFAVNGVNAGGPVAVNGAGTYTTSYAIAQPQGTYPGNISAVFSPPFAIVPGAILGSSGVNSLAVSKENTTVTPSASNPASVQVSAPGGTASSITLSAVIQELADGSLGDISKAAPVTFTLNPVVAAPPVVCSPVTTSVAAGVLTATAACANVPVNAYNVNIVVGGDFYTGSADSVLAVYDPSLGFVTGDGALMHNLFPASFSASVKYPKSGPAKGEVMYIEQRGTANVVLQSNSLTSLSIVKSTAVLLGTATLNGVGGYTFRATLIDNGKGPGNNQFGLQVKNPAGAAVTDLSFAPITLSDGNIKVHQ